MLTIHYNGYDIPTGSDFSVRFSFVNPACFFDKIPGPAGLGIDIPVNDYSRAIFGSPHRFEKYGAGSDRKFQGIEIRFDGVLIMSGTLNITNATSEKYSGWLQGDLGVMGEEQREKFIDELPWKTGIEFENTFTTDDTTHEYGMISFRNSHFWEGKGAETEDEIEYIDENGETKKRTETVSVKTKDFRKNFAYVVNSHNGDQARTTGEGGVVSPFLYLRYVIREILRLNNWYIESNAMVPVIDLSVFKNLMVYNNYNIRVPQFVTVQMTTYWWDYDAQDYVDGEEYVVTSLSWLIDPIDYKYLVPRIAMKDFLLSLQNFLNIVFFFKLRNKVDIVDREAIIDSDAEDIDKYFRGEWVIGERKNCTLKFVSEYDENDSVMGDNYHDLTDRLDDIKESVEDLDALLALTGNEPGDIRLVKSNWRWYEYKWKVISNDTNWYIELLTEALGWEMISVGEQPYFYGTGAEEEEIKTGACTWYRSPGYLVAPLFEVKQRGNIKSMRSIWNDFALRIVNVNEVLHPGGLYYDGEYGLIEQRWKKWAAFWATRLPVEGEFALPLNMLYYVVNNLTKKFKTRHGEFIIEEIEVEFSMNAIGNARIKGYKL